MTTETKHTPTPGLLPAIKRLAAHSRDYGAYDGGSQRQADLEDLRRAVELHDDLIDVGYFATCLLDRVKNKEDTAFIAEKLQAALDRANKTLAAAQGRGA